MTAAVKEKRAPRKMWVAVFVLACLLPGCGLVARRATIVYLAVTTKSRDIEIQINKSFVERYKNRVTIDATFTVDKAMDPRSPPSWTAICTLRDVHPRFPFPVSGRSRTPPPRSRTAAERAVRLLKRGGRLHVYGIPRLDLAEISRRVSDSATKPALLTGPLPYEIIVIGVYPKAK